MIEGRPMSSLCPPNIDMAFKITIGFVMNYY